MFKKFCLVVAVSLIFAVISFVCAVAQDDTQATGDIQATGDTQPTSDMQATEDTQATENAPATGGTQAADASGEVKVDETMCLACHGPYDDIAAATADYVAPSGETVTPHQYVPHNEDPEIPECTECHKPHPIPFESKGQEIKPTKIDWCYVSCHHMNNLMPCKGCH